MLCCKPHLCRRLPRLAGVPIGLQTSRLQKQQSCLLFLRNFVPFRHGTCRILLQRSPQDCRRLVCISSEAAFFSGTQFRFDTGTCRILSRGPRGNAQHFRGVDQASPPAKRQSRLSFVASDARFRHGTCRILHAQLPSVLNASGLSLWFASPSRWIKKTVQNPQILYRSIMQKAFLLFG